MDVTVVKRCSRGRVALRHREDHARPRRPIWSTAARRSARAAASSGLIDLHASAACTSGALPRALPSGTGPSWAPVPEGRVVATGGFERQLPPASPAVEAVGLADAGAPGPFDTRVVGGMGDVPDRWIGPRPQCGRERVAMGGSEMIEVRLGRSVGDEAEMDLPECERPRLVRGDDVDAAKRLDRSGVAHEAAPRRAGAGPPPAERRWRGMGRPSGTAATARLTPAPRTSRNGDRAAALRRRPRRRSGARPGSWLPGANEWASTPLSGAAPRNPGPPTAPRCPSRPR